MQEIPLADAEKPLIFSLGLAGTDWMQACGQKGRCSTCLFDVLEGSENLSAPSEAELRYLAAGRIRSTQRLACQVRLTGDLLISVPPCGRLPHISYEEES